MIVTRTAALAALILFSVFPVLAETGYFGQPAKYPAAINPIDIVSVDFNQDGHLDLATSTYSNEINIYMGNGDGTFRPFYNSDLGQGSSLTRIAAGDFNEDGKPDLAVGIALNSAKLGLGIVLGNGDGTFGPARYARLSIDPCCIAVADLNGDGHLDLWLAGRDGTNVLLGIGDGSFQRAVRYTAGGRVSATTVADIDNDSHPDLVAALFQGGVGIFINKGDGTFNPVSTIAQPLKGAGEVIAADLNLDGIQDLIVAAYKANGPIVLIGKGGGRFASGVSYAGARKSGGLTLADVDSDGNLDAILSTPTTNELFVFTGNGDGTLNAPVATTGVGWLGGLVSADFNGDDKPDLAAADSVSDTTDVLLNISGQ